MTVTQIDLDDDALDRVMSASQVKTKKEAVNLALRFYAERAERIAKHFERGARWGAVADAEERHQAEKRTR
ncbi:type II toxin-antitoxin system VapB family antitoxin [Nocardia sp. SSK8]|uniref:type II toxin-antitoxin system VapB family antitoxin n=1 Tax=Nocardia sp. SSK8 TaxID=3120154 RepID=UPI003009D0DB